MSNRRKLRPSICRAIGPDGRSLVKAATYKDPGAYVPPGPPLNLTPKPRERKFRPGGPVQPMSVAVRCNLYLASTGRSVITPRQRRRALHKAHRMIRRERQAAA